MDNKIKRIKELVTELNKASDLYYNGGKTIMTDKEWDILFNELKALEDKTGVILTSSPTQKVGYEVKNNLEKVQHPKKMLSLDKTKDINELKKFLGNQEGILSWKEDGLTIVLYYENGKLIDSVTRGNGEVGSRIFHNAKVFKSGIPLTINYKGKLVVRGEGLISKEDFEKININGEYANPRNLASGSIMQLDSKIAKQRQLQFKAFSIAECDKEFTTYQEQLGWLEQQGFNIVEWLLTDKNIIENSIENFKQHINEYEFATDGLVLMYDNLQYGKSLGDTLHHPLNAIAFKWQDSTVETTLRDIQFQVGRTGVLTPVAIFDEVEIEGSIVERASLHNLSILKALELGIGDTVTVYKANLIIPQLDDNLTRSNAFKIPTECPECHGKVEIKQTDNAEFLVCTNPNCKAKLVQKISHYCSRDAMNIMGVSSAVIEKLIDKGFIKDIPDLYKLSGHKNEIVTMDGFGKKSYDNLIQSIENSKKCKLANFIYALGINNIGKSTAKDISTYFNNSIDNFVDAVNCNFDFTKIADIGNITNESIYKWVNDTSNNNMFEELLNYIEFEQEQNKPINEVQDNFFKGKKIYATGTFANYKKEQIKEKLESLGADFASGYAKSLDCLLVGSVKGSSKEDKAKKDGIRIITEQEFEDMIK